MVMMALRHFCTVLFYAPCHVQVTHWQCFLVNALKIIQVEKELEGKRVCSCGTY